MIRFSLSIQDNNTDTITPIMSAYYQRTISGYVEGQECCVEKLEALGGRTTDSDLSTNLSSPPPVGLAQPPTRVA